MWPVERLRRQTGGAAPPAEAPLILSARQASRRVVTATNAAARALGLHPGMPVGKAQALVPGLLIEPADPQADAAGLERLALWALERFSPVVAVDAPDGIVIDSTGADHLHGGEAAMLAGLRDRLARAGITARLALADSRGAAHALARFAAAPLTRAAPGEGARLLAALPPEALRLPIPVVQGLRALGFARIGDLYGQPRAPLTRRFGPEPCRRLDQALGRLAEPIVPIRPADPVEARRVFAEPIACAETIARAIAGLTADLCAVLAARGLGARRLDLICHRVDSHWQGTRIGLALPLRDPARLARLLCERIETIDPGFGIEAMVLAASMAEPLAARQETGPLAGEAPAPDLSGLVDRLANRLGPRAVYRLAPVASEVPERSVRRVPALAAAGGGWPDPWPRPLRLLARPEPIETMALLPDHPPHWFTWRGRRHRVCRADGPERIFGEWWKREAERAAVRDYFRVEDEAGARFWIFRAGDGEDAATGSHRWFLHGMFA